MWSRSQTQPTPARIDFTMVLEAIHTVDKQSGNETLRIVVPSAPGHLDSVKVSYFTSNKKHLKM